MLTKRMENGKEGTNMKRWIAIVLVSVMLFAQAALAEIPDISALTDEELIQLTQNIQEEQTLRTQDSENTVTETTEAAEITLQKGDKNEDVRQMQNRLIELNYLAGNADGDFGGKTEAAVKLFQQTADLEATGIADPMTLEKLYATDAPKAKVYNQLNFKDISRDPNAYDGEYYTFTGKVLQVQEGSDYGGTTSTVMRIATKGNYDDVVYVTYERPSSDKRILEDDRVTVYGVCKGLYTYTTIMGGSVTLPKFTAETVSFD